VLLAKALELVTVAGGAVLVVATLGARDRLTRRARRLENRASPIWLAANAGAIARAIAGQPRAAANLAYLGDKSIQWNADGTAFLMYSAHGRSLVALGDAVGPQDAAPELIAQFMAMARARGLMPVFYEVSREHLDEFARHGMAVLKIGEEARVPLEAFSLEGSAFKSLRTSMSRLARERCSFRVVEPPDVSSLIPQLKDVSDAWLDAKGASEKRFSIGYFTRDYLERCPVALIERGDRILAFASVWMTPARIEMSPDLMRHRPDAPAGTMDALFAHLMLWGRQRGFEWCNLGMAPLAGLSSSEGALWARLGRFVYRHGEAFYNFRGLRSYKEKFHPVWEPRYLVYPGGLALPRALADVAALVAGSYRRIFMRTKRRVA
jgi:phosphatidylglycerol lysyltransferase